MRESWKKELFDKEYWKSHCVLKTKRDWAVWLGLFAVSFPLMFVNAYLATGVIVVGWGAYVLKGMR
jgi:hypothetical protein